MCKTGRKAQQKVLAEVQQETITSYFWLSPLLLNHLHSYCSVSHPIPFHPVTVSSPSSPPLLSFPPTFYIPSHTSLPLTHLLPFLNLIISLLPFSVSLQCCFIHSLLSFDTPLLLFQSRSIYRKAKAAKSREQKSV